MVEKDSFIKLKTNIKKSYFMALFGTNWAESISNMADKSKRQQQLAAHILSGQLHIPSSGSVDFMIFKVFF